MYFIFQFSCTMCCPPLAFLSQYGSLEEHVAHPDPTLPTAEGHSAETWTTGGAPAALTGESKRRRGGGPAGHQMCALGLLREWSLRWRRRGSRGQLTCCLGVICLTLCFSVGTSEDTTKNLLNSSSFKTSVYCVFWRLGAHAPPLLSVSGDVSNELQLSGLPNAVEHVCDHKYP